MKNRYDVNRAALVERLWNLGWLGMPDSDRVPRTTAAKVKDAVRAYQAFHGLTVDGWAGPVTERSLAQPRFCGLPDHMEQQADVCHWPQKQVSWTITGSLPGISTAAQKDAYSLGWSYWKSVCGIVPKYVSNARTANVLMGAGRIDRQGGTLAWSELPCAVNSESQLEQKYDTREPWVISATPGFQQIDLVRVAAHEIGHVIGIPHLAAGNLLAPTYDPRVRKPQADDISEAQRRYGNPSLEPAPDDDSPVPDGSLLIRIEGEIDKVSIPGFRIIPLS